MVIVYYLFKRQVCRGEYWS